MLVRAGAGALRGARASDAAEAVASDGDEPAEEELGEELMEEEEVIDEEDG